jgi:hypothetical protein
MARRVSSIIAGLTALAVLSSASVAQSAQVPRVTQACSMLASIISVRIVDRAGRPVRDATVRMTRLRDGKALGLAQEMARGSGEFEIVESSAISGIAPHGDRIRLLVRAGSRSSVATVRIGRDPSGCRLQKLSGPDVVILE